MLIIVTICLENPTTVPVKHSEGLFCDLVIYRMSCRQRGTV